MGRASVSSFKPEQEIIHKVCRWVIVWLAFLMMPALIRAEYFTIRSYDITVKVYGEEGFFEVNEVIQVSFSEARHGIFRQIPYKYNINGKDKKISIYDVEVEGFHFKTYTEGSQFVIKIGEKDIFVEGVQTYKISYKVKKAFLFEEKHTEFYWNLLGDSWPVEVDSVHFTVGFDKPLSFQQEDYGVVTGFTGERGNDVSYSYENGVLRGNSTRLLQPGEGMTVFIRLPLNYIERPGPLMVWWEKYGIFSLAIALFTILFSAFFRVWWKYGRDYKVVDVVAFRPPEGLSPSEAGMLIDDQVDNEDIIALIPYWATQGYLKIQRTGDSRFSYDYTLTRLGALPDSAGDYEHVIFDGLFAGRDSVAISSLKDTFYETLNKAKAHLKNRVNGMGVYYPISLSMQLYAGVFSFFLLLCAAGSFFWLDEWMLAASFFLGAAVGFFFSYHMMKKNEKGIELYQKVKGFKLFVKTAEKDKLERMLQEDADYFEKTLPYAMVFGYAKKWCEKFDGLMTSPPSWYSTQHGSFHGLHGFSSFGSAMEDSAKEINSAFSSTPSNSGGSGGGGSSGGGFGGGGGGSW